MWSCLHKFSRSSNLFERTKIDVAESSTWRFTFFSIVCRALPGVAENVSFHNDDSSDGDLNLIQLRLYTYFRESSVDVLAFLNQFIPFDKCVLLVDLLSERAAFSQASLPTRRLTEHDCAVAANDNRLGVREYSCAAIFKFRRDIREYAASCRNVRSCSLELQSIIFHGEESRSLKYLSTYIT